MDGKPLTAPAAGANDYAVEVVVMLDPPKSVAQSTAQIQSGTRPQVNTESSFGKNPPLSGSSTYDPVNAPMPLSEHTTSAYTGNSYPAAGAAHAAYNQAAISAPSNFTNASQPLSASGNVANPAESTPLEGANLTVPAAGPMYIVPAAGPMYLRTGPSSGPPEGAGGAITNSVYTGAYGDPMGSNYRGSVRGKQQEKYNDDAIPYHSYEATTKNEDKRKTSNKSKRRHRG
jgi:hypothetical protein